MQLYLIRHAESENNARPGYLRVEDPPITTIGRMQADHLAAWTRTLKIDTLITSPFLRTLQTTRAVVDATQLPVSIWHTVFERGGCYRGYGDDAKQGGMGLGRSAIEKLIPGSTIDETIPETGWWGGRDRETHEDAVVRAGQVIKRLEATFGNNGHHVVAIIHADFKRQLLIQMLAGLADASAFGPLRNTGITKVDFDGTRWRLDWLNSVSHLPAKIITGVE
jgi:2,3-bisphosphoglycerate-dependent phosphoglycerate mutase